MHARRQLKRWSSLYILPDLLQRRSSELGGLELEELIGRGSFGRVYKGAPDPLLELYAAKFGSVSGLDLPPWGLLKMASL